MTDVVVITNWFYVSYLAGSDGGRLDLGYISLATNARRVNIPSLIRHLRKTLGLKTVAILSVIEIPEHEYTELLNDGRHADQAAQAGKKEVPTFGGQAPGGAPPPV